MRTCLQKRDKTYCLLDLVKVMVNILCMCTVWGEPLSQTAQSFMPEMIYGAKRNLMKVPILNAHFCVYHTIFFPC
jgi:hypothetical protein